MFSFIAHATQYLTLPRLDEQRPPSLWPSEASAIIKNKYGEEEVIGKCLRASYFRYLCDVYYYSPTYNTYKDLVEHLQDKIIPPDTYQLWLWKQGELYERYCVELAKESGIWVASQVYLYVPSHNLSGKLDLVVRNPSADKFHIVEAKSVYGFNSNEVLGTPGERKKGQLGKPRHSNLMQVGLYQWWYANRRPEFHDAFLTYGARDTGRYGEYRVWVRDEEGEQYIFYRGCAPVTAYPFVDEEVNSGISIENILSRYEYVTKCIESGEIPAKSFELQYSEEKIALLYERDELPKKDKEQFEKRKEQIESGKSRVVKKVERGDWQCRVCQWKNVCYNKDSTPVSF